MKKFLFTSIILSLFMGYGTAQRAKITMSITIGEGNADKRKGCASSTRGLGWDLRSSDSTTSTATIISTTWTINDPSGNSVQGTPFHTNTYLPNYGAFFTQPGRYTIILCHSWSSSKSHCDTAYIDVIPYPQVTISKTSPDSVCPGVGIGFKFDVLPPYNAGIFNNFLWDFGDGVTSTQPSPKAPYANGGNTEISYNVTLQLKDTNGCSANTSEQNFAFIHAKPVVNFEEDPNSSRYFCFGSDIPNPTGTTLFKNNTDAGKPLYTNSYFWRFGDGNTSSSVHPSNVYGLGMHSVTLIATNQFGCTDSLTKPNFVRVRQLVTNYKIDGVSNSKVVTVCSIPDTINVEGLDGTVGYLWNIIDITTGYSPFAPVVGRTGSFRIRNLGDTGKYYLILKIEDNSQLGNSCTVIDTILLYVFNNFTPEITVTDTNECDPNHVVTFKNTTKYPWKDDFGLGAIYWNFGDGITGGPADTVTHVYGSFATPTGGVFDDGYGDYTAYMYGTTPYGCPLGPIVQKVHIFRMEASLLVIDPGPPNPPHGCAPHSVTLDKNPMVDPWLISSSPIVSFMWKMNYRPLDRNLEPDSLKVPIVGEEPLVTYEYKDTGWYRIFVTLVNEQGCEHDVDITTIQVGYPPITNFTYIPDTGCKSSGIINSTKMISIAVTAYDSVIVDCNTGDSILVANSRANDWSWLDYKKMGPPPNGNPGKNSSIVPLDVGSAYTMLMSSHNGCPTNLPVIKDDIGYLCPPVTAIDNPKDPMPGVHPLYCKFPKFAFELDTNYDGPQPGPMLHDCQGVIEMQWFAGDAYPTGLANYYNQSMSPILKIDTNDMIYKAKNTHLYPPKDTISIDGGWAYTYSDSVNGVYSNYIYQNNGVIVISLIGINDASVLQDTVHNHNNVRLKDTFNLCCYPIDTIARFNGNFPLVLKDSLIIEYGKDSLIRIKCDTLQKGGEKDTVLLEIVPLFPEFYNPCGYCEAFSEQIIHISTAKMDFTAVTPRGPNQIHTDWMDNRERVFHVCQNDSVTFIDSTISSVGLFGWGFKFDSAWNVGGNYLETWMLNGYASIGKWFPIEDYTPTPVPFPTAPGVGNGKGQTITFTRPNIYRLVLQDTCVMGCIRRDTLVIQVRPQSIPAVLTGKNGATPTAGQDIICANANDTLYIQDASWSPPPFQNTELKGWEWRLGSLKDTNQNPTFIPKTAGTFDLILTLKNEYGCDSMHYFQNQVIVNNVIADFVPPNDLSGNPQKVFCNKEPITFTSTSTVMLQGNNQRTRIHLTYDWGDNTSDTMTVISGQRLPIRHTYNFQALSTTVYIRLTASIIDSVTRMPIGCKDEFIDSYTIVRPYAAFEDDGNNFPCPDESGPGTGRTIKFTDKSLGRIQYWQWEFGDGDIAYVKNPAHNYKKPGIYDVLLIVTDSAFGSLVCSDSVPKPGLVNIQGARGSFSYTLGKDDCAPATIEFQPTVDSTEGGVYLPDSIIILTDDGNMLGNKGDYTALVRPKTWQYRQGGAYLPTYFLYKQVFFNGKWETCMIQINEEDTIYVVDLKPNFDTISLYCPNLPITFPNTTTLIPGYLPYDSIAWNFGNEYTSDQYEDPTSYDSAGIYTVQLTEKVLRCIKTKKTNIEVMRIPDMYILPDTAESCDGLDVLFTADSLLDELDISRIVNYHWKFGSMTLEGAVVDPFTLDTNMPLAIREFGISGHYPLVLKLTFTPVHQPGDLECSKIYYDTVTVFAYPSPIARFEADPMVGEVDQDFKFTDKSIKGGADGGNIVRWFWDFEDGETSPDSLQSTIKHAYTTTSGFITVTLWIVDEHGCKSDTNVQITVIEKLAFPNVFTPNGNCDGKKCQFRPTEDKGFFKKFKLEVYDRYGMLVWNKYCEHPGCPDYQSDNFWWDGTNKQGKPVSDGVYYWVVYAEPLSETAPFIKNGSVTVVNKK